MADVNKARKLGRGLAGLMGTPVAVPLPPQVDQPIVEDKKSHNPIATEQKPSYVPAPATPRVSAPAPGVSGGAVPATPAAMKQASAAQLAAAPLAAPTPYLVVRVDEVTPNRFQPRRDFEPDALAALAASIKRDGVMQPLVVRKASRDQGSEGSGRSGGALNTAKWELVAGERRWRAAQAAGLTHVPAVIVDIPDVTAAMWAVVENVQRVDLGAMEKSHAYARLSKEFGLTQSEISDQVGEDRTLVSHYIRLGELEPAVTALIESGKITFGHGKVLNSPLVKPGEVRVALAERAAHEALSVRQLELLVQRGGGKSLSDARTITWTPNSVALSDVHAQLEGAVKDAQKRIGIDHDAAKAKAFEARANIRDLEEQIGKHLGTKVKIKTAGNGKRGTLAIEFFSLDHFDGLVQKMGVKRES